MTTTGLGSAGLIIFTFVAFLLLLSFVQSNNTDFVVAGYLPDYRFYIDLNQTVLDLTDLLLFSVDAKPSLLSDNCCLHADHFKIVQQARAFKQKEQSRDLRVWLTIGGAGRSSGFPALFGDTERQKTFLQKLIDLVKAYDLYGIDFDCELPFSKQEYYDYMLFLRAACDKLHDAGVHVSVALHPQQALPKAIATLVDRVHLMAYDMLRRQGAQPEALHHAELDQVRKAVHLLVDNDAPGARKIVLGIPAYGRHESNPERVKTFAEIVDEMDAVPDTRNSWRGFRFDAPKDVRTKVAYARDAQLAGVFLWELGQDKATVEHARSGILLRAAGSGKLYTDTAIEPEL
ncbi:chitinase glycoside hydrolase family 1 [Phaeodactylum tricornutum CCAP 1055/1]|jgi:GH18 family chitinase|uniref:Chitinase glycoside hydrolase family 1 n=1 Tax=Phaeodactylum tricornutum (strain CCAP 1055/1) TaxID=556484 RepID=B7FW03_PHATC|nr:chitinase glycoside hydrolase family 1 [Phaeodactylum tricornutum CCAP 1055/1]EEC49496.1 chitinase glycoside hydrolase family 1 [Phaeodactylum tricornutum CCAP 1055/1]|eukprot:XP_002178798.1 chitinase glycoside hydrolase family 1 [Phaeodactylum tricornutum CCAP 1055/1]